MAAYRRLYGFGHLRADCPGPASTPEHARFEYGTTFASDPQLRDVVTNTVRFYAVITWGWS